MTVLPLPPPQLDFRPEGDLLDELAAQCVAKVRLFAQKELANILWAYGRLEHRPDGLLEAAGEWAAPRLSSFSPQVGSLLPPPTLSPTLSPHHHHF